MGKVLFNRVCLCVVILLIPCLLNTTVGNQIEYSSQRFDPPPWPTEGLVGVTYMFCLQIPEDPEGDQFFIFWDWGDGITTGWLGPYASGEITCASHAWDTRGLYTIQVTLKDTEGNETTWVPWMIRIYEITTCDIHSAQVSFGNIWFDITNTGEDDAYRLNWSIDIQVIISPPRIPWFWNGTIPNLEAGHTERIYTNRFLMSFGLRAITITITGFNVETLTKIYRGFFLGPIIILNQPLKPLEEM